MLGGCTRGAYGFSWYACAAPTPSRESSLARAARARALPDAGAHSLRGRAPACGRAGLRCSLPKNGRAQALPSLPGMRHARRAKRSSPPLLLPPPPQEYARLKEEAGVKTATLVEERTTLAAGLEVGGSSAKGMGRARAAPAACATCSSAPAGRLAGLPGGAGWLCIGRVGRGRRHRGGAPAGALCARACAACFAAFMGAPRRLGPRAASPQADQRQLAALKDAAAGFTQRAEAARWAAAPDPAARCCRPRVGADEGGAGGT